MSQWGESCIRCSAFQNLKETVIFGIVRMVMSSNEGIMHNEVSSSCNMKIMCDHNDRAQEKLQVLGFIRKGINVTSKNWFAKTWWHFYFEVICMQYACYGLKPNIVPPRPPTKLIRSSNLIWLLSIKIKGSKFTVKCFKCGKKDVSSFLTYEYWYPFQFEREFEVKAEKLKASEKEKLQLLGTQKEVCCPVCYVLLHWWMLYVEKDLQVCNTA